MGTSPKATDRKWKNKSSELLSQWKIFRVCAVAVIKQGWTYDMCRCGLIILSKEQSQEKESAVFVSSSYSKGEINVSWKKKKFPQMGLEEARGLRSSSYRSFHGQWHPLGIRTQAVNSLETHKVQCLCYYSSHCSSRKWAENSVMML